MTRPTIPTTALLAVLAAGFVLLPALGDDRSGPVAAPSAAVAQLWPEGSLDPAARWAERLRRLQVLDGEAAMPADAIPEDAAARLVVVARQIEAAGLSGMPVRLARPGGTSARQAAWAAAVLDRMGLEAAPPGAAAAVAIEIGADLDIPGPLAAVQIAERVEAELLGRR